MGKATNKLAKERTQDTESTRDHSTVHATLVRQSGTWQVDHRCGQVFHELIGLLAPSSSPSREQPQRGDTCLPSPQELRARLQERLTWEARRMKLSPAFASARRQQHLMASTNNLAPFSLAHATIFQIHRGENFRVVVNRAVKEW